MLLACYLDQAGERMTGPEQAPVEEPSHYEGAASIADTILADNAFAESNAGPVVDPGPIVTADLLAAQVKATLALADAINALRLLLADRP